MRLVYSVREPEDVIYADELGDDALLTYTREPRPAGPATRAGSTPGCSRMASRPEIAFVCGSNGFVESASKLLLDTGLAAERIRTERFGPTGF